MDCPGSPVAQAAEEDGAPSPEARPGLASLRRSEKGRSNPKKQPNSDTQSEGATFGTSLSHFIDASDNGLCAFDTHQVSYTDSNGSSNGHVEMISDYTTQNVFDIPLSLSDSTSSPFSQSNLQSFNYPDEQIMISCEELQDTSCFDMTDVSLFTTPLYPYQDAVNELWGYNGINTTGASSSLANSVPSRTPTPSWSSNLSSGCSLRSSPPPEPTSAIYQSSIPDTRRGCAWPPARLDPSASGTKGHFAVQTLPRNSQSCSHTPSRWHGNSPYRGGVTAVSIDRRHVTVEALSSHARDRLMVTTQSVLHLACDILSAPGYLGQDGANTNATLSSCVTFPSSEMLEHYLRSYVTRYETYHGLVQACTLDPTKLIMEKSNEDVPAILLLLMIAQGARLVRSPEASNLSTALTEAFKIVLKDLKRKDNPYVQLQKYSIVS